MASLVFLDSYVLHLSLGEGVLAGASIVVHWERVIVSSVS